MRIYIKYVTRHLPYPYFSRNFGYSLWRTFMFLWSIHTENTRQSAVWNYFRCITNCLIRILQRHGHILSILRHLRYQLP